MDAYNLETTSLARAHINLILPSFSKLIIDYETNVYNFHERFYDRVCVREYCTEGESITILDKINKSFDILDSVLDDENAEMAGKDLTHKYKTMKKNTDYEIVFSQIYRVLIVLRNAKVHEQKSIFIDKENISIIRRDKNIEFIAKKDILVYILSYAIYCGNIRNIEINECYKLNIALWYYSKINSLILNFIDHGNIINLMNTAKNTLLSGINPRYICENVRYEIINNDIIKLDVGYNHFYSENRNNNLLDFVFVLDNRYFMIPYEIIKNGKVNISELWMFEFMGDKLKYLDNFYNRLV